MEIEIMNIINFKEDYQIYLILNFLFIYSSEIDFVSAIFSMIKLIFYQNIIRY
jgi:hypothetical protein